MTSRALAPGLDLSRLGRAMPPASWPIPG